MLKTLSAQQKTNWKDHLPKLAFAYNSTVCKSTGFSPFELIFGRSSRLPVDFMFNTDDINPNRLSYQEFVRKWSHWKRLVKLPGKVLKIKNQLTTNGPREWN